MKILAFVIFISVFAEPAHERGTTEFEMDRRGRILNMNIGISQKELAGELFADKNCHGTWGSCSNGYTCEQRYTISTPVRGAGNTCEATHGQTRDCVVKTNCVPCTDTDNGAVNKNGKGCIYYSENDYMCRINSHKDDDFISSQMCCACGGGNNTLVNDGLTDLSKCSASCGSGFQTRSCWPECPGAPLKVCNSQACPGDALEQAYYTAIKNLLPANFERLDATLKYSEYLYEDIETCEEGMYIATEGYHDALDNELTQSEFDNFMYIGILKTLQDNIMSWNSPSSKCGADEDEMDFTHRRTHR